MEKVVTDVLSRLPWSEDVDEASMAESRGESKQSIDGESFKISTAEKKWWEMISVLLRLLWLHSLPVQGHSGANKVDRSLHNNVEIP